MTAEEQFIALADEMIDRIARVKCDRDEYLQGLDLVIQRMTDDLVASRAVKRQAQRSQGRRVR